jgi:hypothetical protein
MRRARGAGVLGSAVALLVLLGTSPIRAQQPPGSDCRRASKIEYDSAKREYLLRHKFGAYVRTGYFWRRYYWYCHL